VHNTSDARFEPEGVGAAVFDIGGVFLYPNFELVKTLQNERGLKTSDDLDVYRQAHHAGCRALADQTQAVAEHSHDFWIGYDRAYATALGVPAHHHDEFRVAIRCSWDWPHQANIDAFHRLAATGLPLAIVSNNDGSAEPSMKEFGICQVGPGPLPSVAIIVDSMLAGVAKPDPAIMRPALDALGVEPDHVLYVGDTVHADVVGATNAGMQVVQLDPFDHHADYPHPRLVDLDSLVAVLTNR
jgi:FMN phosphatase YigB (HAD superfamily)